MYVSFALVMGQLHEQLTRQHVLILLQKLELSDDLLLLLYGLDLCVQPFLNQFNHLYDILTAGFGFVAHEQSEVDEV